MRILFTGTSSFTGFWFIRQLAAAGHEVHAVLQHPLTKYQEIRGERVALLRQEASVTLHEQISFGTPAFKELIGAFKEWDQLSHHGAQVTHYRSPDFDPLQALQTNTLELEPVLQLLRAKGCRRMVLTGSVFEGDAGLGPDSERSFSPYGLSKKLTCDYARFYCERAGFSLGQFVIPNPFGPYEEARFTRHLMQQWSEGHTPVVHVPRYIRDNIHVSLLAKAYVYFCEQLSSTSGFQRWGPCGYVESQGAFSQRFAREMSRRLDWDCPLTLLEQTEFPEPYMRVNTDPVEGWLPGWSSSQETEAWNALAEYYANRLQRKAMGASS